MSSLALMAVASQASFELLHVLDIGSKSIKRFDPETGAYLGQYGQNLLNPSGLAYAGGRTYTMDSGSSRLMCFNAYTGSVVTGIFETANSAVGALGNTILVARPTTGATFSIAQYDLNLTLMATYNWAAPVATGWTPNDIGASGSTIVVTGSTGGWSYSLTGMSGTVTASVNSLKYTGADSGGLVYGLQETASGNLNPRRDLVGGHFYNYFSGQNSSNVAQGRISAAVGVVGSFTSFTFGESVLITPTHLAIQNAPEPGTWLALGLGGLALIRRRKA